MARALQPVRARALELVLQAEEGGPVLLRDRHRHGRQARLQRVQHEDEEEATQSVGERRVAAHEQMPASSDQQGPHVLPARLAVRWDPTGMARRAKDVHEPHRTPDGLEVCKRVAVAHFKAAHAHLHVVQHAVRDRGERHRRPLGARIGSRGYASPRGHGRARPVGVQWVQ
eukprot:scaffold24018_cov69-Phaeocystis_antarctica.AAC.1